MLPECAPTGNLHLVGKESYRKTILENGIRVVSESMPGTRSIALGIVIDAGPQCESSSQSGLAHLTEHLLFQGTSSRSAKQLAQLMDLAGGQMGGFTSRDYTCYYASVLDEHCTYALDIFGDVLLNSTFPPECLEREKEAIVCEIEAARDTPAERAHDLLKGHAWADHPLGRPIAGRVSTVRNLEREDIIYFVHENYLPDRIVIAAAGNVDHEDLVAQVRDGFWRMLGESSLVLRQPPRTQGGVLLEHQSLAQAYFALGLPALPYAHPDRYTLHVLNSVVGGGISSRLFRTLREERGLVYQIGSDYQAYRDAGMWVIEGSTTPEHLCQVITRILGELHGLANGTDPVEEEELWRAKTQIRRQHLLAAESTSTRVSRLATQELYFGRQLPTEEILGQIEAVDVESLRRWGAEELQPALENLTVAVVGPDASDHYDLETLQALAGQFR